ncbi:ribonuclease H-like domain-containing protein, partial [Tanacetum coccineum]
MTYGPLNKWQHYLALRPYPIWEVIQNGNVHVSITTDTQGQIKKLPPKTTEEILARERERKSRTTLLMALPEDHLAKFHKITDAKEMWEAIRSRFGGNDESKKMQKYILKQQFEGFSVSNSEGLHKGYDRFQSLLSQLEIHGAGVSTEDANQKFLRSLPSAWSQVSLIMRTKPGVDSLSFDDMYNNLRVFENDVKGSTASSSSSTQNVAFVSKNTSSTNDVSTAYGVLNPSGPTPQYEQTSIILLLANQYSALNFIMRIWNSFKSIGFRKKWDLKCRSKGNQDSKRSDAWNSRNKDGRRSGKQEDSKALVTIDGEDFSVETHESLPELAVNEPKVVSQPNVWSDAHNIEEYESDSEDEHVTLPIEEQETPSFANKQVKTHRETVKNQFTHSKNPKVDKKGLGYGFTTKACFVCGSLSHLIRDCDFHEKRMAKQVLLIGDQKKNISGTMSPNTMVGFKSRNYLCQGRNKFFSLHSECPVFVPVFKLPDANQVLLRIPRQKNMYSFNLENIVPSGGLARLIAKDTIDEANKWHKRFSWVFFLRTKDETSGILKDFIRQIENQLNQKVKTIRCDNGTEFKNRDIIEFCGSKGIKREYSNARTPQQNGVAERKNMTLIEAARTMLADSFLPNTFWAEAPVRSENQANKTAGPKEANHSAVKILEAKNEGEKPNKNTSLKINEEPEFAQDTEDLLLQTGAARATSTNTVNTTSTPVSTTSPSGG